MGENILRRLYVKRLKGLSKLDISFSKPLTAIMGVNGSGKTTILHALACVYSKERAGETYNFSHFFVPNPDSKWAGSELRVWYRQGEIIKSGPSKGKYLLRSKQFIKKKDRWGDYSNRPKRDVFYLGIDTCMPEIERRNHNTYVPYTTLHKDDRVSDKVVKQAAFILNKNYESLLEHHVKSRFWYGVKLDNGLKYSALSMGTGEQRVIKILDTVFRAQDYSLILIDEIDLLLHNDAFRKMLCIINEEATRKKLQIIFTTHSLMIDEFDFIDIRYIENTLTKTLVHTGINTGMIYSMTGQQPRPIKVYVEDAFAQVAVSKIAKELNMRKKIDIHLFGSAQNSFTLAASIILKKEPIDNVLIVLDGDKYTEDSEKLDQIKKALSGTEDDISDRWNKALALITQFSLPDDCKHPENFIHSILINNNQNRDEYVDAAREVVNVNNKHQFIDDIVERIGDKYDVVVNDILTIISSTDKWLDYSARIREWLNQRKDL